MNQNGTSEGNERSSRSKEKFVYVIILLKKVNYTIFDFMHIITNSLLCFWRI